MMFLLALSLSVTPPLATETLSAAPVSICKVVRDHTLKSRRIRACGTEEQWQTYQAQLQKRNREHRAHAQAYAGVGSGY